MAWKRLKGRIYHIGWRPPGESRPRTKSAHTSDPVTAELERLRVERTEEGKSARVDASATARETFDRWLEDLAATGRRKGTVDGYRGKVGPVVRRLKRPLATWDAADVKAVVFGRKSWGPNSRAAALRFVVKFLRWAARSGVAVPASLIEDVRAIEKPIVRVADRQALPEAALVSLLAAVRGERIEPAVALAAFNGFPLGDIRALRRSELDLKAGTVHRRYGREKTGERYVVPLAPPVLEVLARHVVEDHPEGLALDLPPKRRMFGLLDEAYERAGLDRPRGECWHRLRRSFASMLDGNGEALATVRMLMGHAPGSTATLRYLSPERRRAVDAVAKIGRAQPER